MLQHLGSLTVWAATEADNAVSVVPNWLKLLITAGVFLVPYGLGVLIARQLKMKEYAGRISIVLFAATLGVLPFVYQSLLGQLEQQQYEQALAEWEAEQDDQPITPEGLEKLKKEEPGLRIIRTPEEAAESELASAPAN